MTNATFDAIRAAVNVARNEQVKKLDQLRSRLLELGYATADVEEAIRYWSDSQRRLGVPPP